MEGRNGGRKEKWSRKGKEIKRKKRREGGREGERKEGKSFAN